MKNLPNPAPKALVEQSFEIDLDGKENPRSVINLAGDLLRSRITESMRLRPDLFRKTEKDLKKDCKPTPTDTRIRLAFWNEYNRVQESGAEKIDTAAIYSGVCTKQLFYYDYLMEPRKVAWMMCPPANYLVALNEMLLQGQNKLREILDAEVVDSKGKVDTKVGELILKIYLAVENRVKGTTITRTEVRGEIKSMNLHAPLPPGLDQAGVAKAALSAQVGETMEDIEEQLRKLRALNRKEARNAVTDAVVAGDDEGSDAKPV